MNKYEKQQVLTTVLNPLLEIIYEYKMSEFYNYIPAMDGTKVDGWNHYEMRFNYIFSNLGSLIYLDDYTYDRIYQIIIGIKTFVRKFESIDSLPYEFFGANPRLRYFGVTYELMDNDYGAYEKSKESGFLKYLPDEYEYQNRQNYLAGKHQFIREHNFQQNEDDLLIQELALATRILFKNILY